MSVSRNDPGSPASIDAPAPKSTITDPRPLISPRLGGPVSAAGKHGHEVALGDQTCVVVAIDDLVLASRDSANLQPITWRRANWSEIWEAEPGLAGHEVLDMIDAEVAGDGRGTIRRSWLRSLAYGDPVVLLTASTIWGYGNYVRRGRPALRAMLRTPGVALITKEIIDEARRDAAAGFSALFDGGGRVRVARLGIAFGTKVVHFAGYEHCRPRPLVLDARVYRAAQEFAPTAPVPNPARYTTGIQYRAYCEWAGEVAARNGVEPETVEYALFLNGASDSR